MSWRSAAIATFLALANSVSPAIGAPDTTTCDEVDLAVTTSPVPPQFSKNLRRHYWLRDLLPGGPVDFLLIGDSLVEMWPQEAWTASFPDTTVLNLGVGGDTTQNVLWRLSKMPLTRIQPRRVALLIGTNNLSHKDKPCAILPCRYRSYFVHNPAGLAGGDDLRDRDSATWV
jgi:hypothetical protein